MGFAFGTRGAPRDSCRPRPPALSRVRCVRPARRFPEQSVSAAAAVSVAACNCAKSISNALKLKTRFGRLLRWARSRRRRWTRRRWARRRRR